MEQIEYTRTVVPSSMRSPYWKYFGFPSDNANNILTRQKIVCTICNTAITYNKNTSNLRTHLMSKHLEIFQKIIVELSGTKGQINEKDFNHTTTEECYTPETIEVTPNKRLCSEVQDDNRVSVEWSTNTVPESFIIIPESNSNLEEQNKGFTKNCSSDVQIENCNYINLEDNFNDQELIEVVELTDEEINDSNPRTCMSDKAAFTPETTNGIQDEKLMDSLEIMLADMVQTDLLTLDAITTQGFCRYNQQLTGISIDDGIIERIMEIIEERFTKTQQMINMHVANLSQMEPYSLSIEVYEDTGHDKVMNIYFNYLKLSKTEMASVLYRSCAISYTASPNISDILSPINLINCSGIVVPCLRNVPDFILNFAESHGIAVVECLESMFTHCLRKIYESCEFSQDFEKIMRGGTKILHNKTYTPKSGSYWSKLQVLENVFKNFEQHELEQWRELQDCIEYLKPLQMAFNIVAHQTLSPCSLIRPIVIKLYEEYFISSKSQPSSVKIPLIQKILQKELYDKVIMQDYLKEATFFDPRFHRDFAYPETVFCLKEIKSRVIKRFQSVLNITGVKQYEKSALKEASIDCLKNSGKSSTLKTFFKRNPYLKNSEIVEDAKTDLDSELELYFMNEQLDLDQSPALWWCQQAKNNFKQLSKIANFYLTVPCYYMPRMCDLDVEQRRFIFDRRKQLNQLCPIESKLWYLYYNTNNDNETESI